MHIGIYPRSVTSFYSLCSKHQSDPVKQINYVMLYTCLPWWPLRKRYRHQSKGLQTRNLFCIKFVLSLSDYFSLCHIDYLSTILDVILGVQKTVFKLFFFRLLGTNTVPERKFVTKIRVLYHDPRWHRQQLVRMFTPRFLLFRIVFHVFDAGYRAIVSYCFYVIPEFVMEFDKTAVNCTKHSEDLGNSSVRSW